MQEPTIATLAPDTQAAARLYGLGVISGAVYAELKQIATRLNAFSDAPAANALSPELAVLQRASVFCGFWSAGSYLGALRELAQGIEANPPLSVQRAEYLERVKTLAAGINALGLYVRDVHQGIAPSCSALNEQFARVIRKARPVLLELPPAQLAPIMFMPVPPSLEIEARWAAQPQASHARLLQALAAAGAEPTVEALRTVAQCNPYRTLSGLLESVACQARDLDADLASSVKEEYARIEGLLRAGVPAAPPVPDSFLFSRLLFKIAFASPDEPHAATLRKRYSLIKPRDAAAGPGEAVSMLDVARKFAVAMAKFRDVYLQSALSNTPAPIVKLSASVLADAHKLESRAFSRYAGALHEHTRDWSPRSELSVEQWTHGAALLLLLQESAGSWGNEQAQDDLAALAEQVVVAGSVGPCETMQQATRIAAIKKACTVLLARSAELKVAIEGALRSVGDTELNESQRNRLVEVVGKAADELLGVITGFCTCVGLPAAAAFAQHLAQLMVVPATWQTGATREELFDGLARLTLFLGRVRPGSLIDIQADELGRFAPDGLDANEVDPGERVIRLGPGASEEEGGIVALPAGETPSASESSAATEARPGGADRADLLPTDGAPELEGVLLEAALPGLVPEAEMCVANDEVSLQLDEVRPAKTDANPSAHEVSTETGDENSFAGDLGGPAGGDFQFGDDMQPAPARRKEPVATATLTAEFLGARRDVPDVLDAGDAELLKVMFEESDQCMTDLERCLEMWSAPDASPRRLVGTVSDMRRHIHTLKGVCRTCGLEGVGEVLHAMETRLELTADDGLDLAADLPAYADAAAAVRRTLERARTQFARGLSGPLPSDELADGPSTRDPAQPHAPQQLQALSQVDEDAGAAAAAAGEAGQAARFQPTDDADQGPKTPAQPLGPEPEAESRSLGEVEEEARADSPPGSDAGWRPQPKESQAADRESAKQSDCGTTPATPVDAAMAQSGGESSTSPGTPTSELAVTRETRIAKAAPAPSGSVRIPLQLAARVGDASGHLLAASRRSLEIGERSARSFKEVESNIKRMAPVLRELDILATASIQSAASGSTHGFDPLELDRYTALQELVRRLKEAFEDSVGSIESLAQDLRVAKRADHDHVQLSDDLQRESSELTLVAVASQRARLEQVVARACKDTGKAASLTIETGCHVPAAALDKLMPVFEHLLRNAVAHGIEPPQARALAGKPATGVITIAPGQAGTGVPDASVLRLCVRDDGAGIDHDGVLAAAFKRGIAVRGERYSPEAIRELLFVPGFSTASSLSQLSGRGVGLDVVRAAMASLGGMVSVDCGCAGGAEFMLTLPTDTSSMSVLPVSANGYHCMLPLAMVSRIVPVSSSLGVQLEAGGKQVLIGGERFELVHLAARVPAARRQARPGRGHLVLMREGTATKAILVDTVGNQTRVVVRQLGPFVRDVPGFVAGTALPNGSVCIVLNPLRLQEIAAAERESAAARPEQAKQVLVVDDSSTVRLVTSRFLRRVGFEPLAARDGLEALQMIAKGARPAAILCDIEMPGMGGFELIAELRQKPEFAGVPIVVISSRTATKHRERARQVGATAYLSKPYEDSQLLEILRG